LLEVGFQNKLEVIRFDNILPKPLEGLKHGENSVWERQFELDITQKTLLNASSGKGKTTFIHLLYGLRTDYSGQISFNGENIKKWDINRWTAMRKDVFSVIFQDLQLFPNLSTEENLRLKWDLGSDLSFDEVLDFLAKLGLKDKRNQSCGTLSQGQQQRVAIVRALIPKFQYLLMDEPFSHLDEENTNVALNLILNRCESLKSGCLMTTLGETYNNKFNQILYL
jgi:putative ABC transport system ATP-binding protein